MSVKRKSYNVDLKAKFVLEVLEREDNRWDCKCIWSTTVSLKNWKKQFFENMSLAFDKSTVIKEYKDEI